MYWTIVSRILGAQNEKEINSRETYTEDQGQNHLLLCLQLEMPDHWDRHEKNPDIGDEVRNVREVCECDHDQTLSSYVCVPVGRKGATGEEKGDGDANSPSNNKSCGRKDDFAEDGMYEDAVVEGQNTKFDGDKSEIIEMAEDIVALADHHLIVCRHDYDVPAHAMRRTKSEAARTLTDKTDRSEEDEVVVEGDAVPSVAFGPQSQAGADDGCGYGDAVDPVYLGNS